MSNPSAPDESPDTLFREKGWLQGAIVGGVGYGVDLVLFLICFYVLLWQARIESRFRWTLLVFSCLIFTLSTLFMGSLAQFTQMAFVDNRNFTGGPNGYELSMFSVPQSELGNVAFVVQNWTSDLMMVWRCFVVYRGCRFRMWLVLLLPALMYATTFTLGLLWLIQISQFSPFSSSSINWTTPYFGFSLSLNIVLTIAIVGRLFVHRHREKKTLGPSYGTHYTSMAAIITESAALYSIFSLLFIVPFALNHPISPVFLQSLCQVQAASSLLIVFRVAQGKGWTGNTTHRTSTGIRGSTLDSMQLSSRRYPGGTSIDQEEGRGSSSASAAMKSEFVNDYYWESRRVNHV